MGALGVLGSEGDSADLMYVGVIAVGFFSALVVRFQPIEMANALFAMALSLGVIVAIALSAGLHNEPYSSVFEIVGLNAFFAAMFVAAGLLFRYSARERHSELPSPASKR
jgi:hypothetical protein